MTPVTSADQLTCEFCIWKCIVQDMVVCGNRVPQPEQPYDIIQYVNSFFCREGEWIIMSRDGSYPHVSGRGGAVYFLSELNRQDNQESSNYEDIDVKRDNMVAETIIPKIDELEKKSLSMLGDIISGVDHIRGQLSDLIGKLSYLIKKGG